MASDKLHYRIGKEKAVCFSFLPKNRHACFEVWRLNIRCETTHEPVDDMIHHVGNLIWLTVRGKYDLFIFEKKFVKNSKKLFLCTGLSTKKLNVINKQ